MRLSVSKYSVDIKAEHVYVFVVASIAFGLLDAAVALSGLSSDLLRVFIGISGIIAAFMFVLAARFMKYDFEARDFAGIAVLTGILSAGVIFLSAFLGLDSYRYAAAGPAGYILAMLFRFLGLPVQVFMTFFGLFMAFGLREADKEKLKEIAIVAVAAFILSFLVDSFALLLPSYLRYWDSDSIVASQSLLSAVFNATLQQLVQNLYVAFCFAGLLLFISKSKDRAAVYLLGAFVFASYLVYAIFSYPDYLSAPAGQVWVLVVLGATAYLYGENLLSLHKKQA